MCQEPDDLDEDDWNEDDWDDEWEQPPPSQFGLIGVVFRHDNDEQPWLVQDNRKALKSDFPCQTKAEVLDKIAEILDDMHHPPARLDQNSEPLNVAVTVTLQVSLCDLENQVNILDLRRAAAEAVANAIHHHEQVCFDHFLADIVSLSLVEVRALNAE